MRHMFRLIGIVLSMWLIAMFGLWLLIDIPNWVWWGIGIIWVLWKLRWLVLGLALLDLFDDC